MFLDLPPAASWRHEGARDGFETVFATVEAAGTRLRGVTAAVEAGEPWWVHYDIVIDRDWCTRRAEVRARTTRGSQRVVVQGDGAGNWTVGGSRRPELVGCRDVDLESSACTNTFPVHRMKLMVGQQCEAPAAYVRALDATVERLEQSYRRLDDAGGQHVYHYESPGFDFVARLTYDDRGLVVDYPGIATRCF